MMAEIAERWIGSFNNHRHIEHNAAWGPPSAPELSAEKREMRVLPIRIPELGDTVLYLEEFRAGMPGIAHRQRVISLVWDARYEQVRARQHFFRAGPTYDRRALSAEQIQALTADDFDRIPRCDLFFEWQAEYQRYRGAMQRRACSYEHEESGMVYAEFEMLLYADQQWYRDRSIRLASNTIRGQIDGFAYLRFDKLAD